MVYTLSPLFIEYFHTKVAPFYLEQYILAGAISSLMFHGFQLACSVLLVPTAPVIFSLREVIWAKALQDSVIVLTKGRTIRVMKQLITLNRIPSLKF